jgi:hypothetical protein
MCSVSVCNRQKRPKLSAKNIRERDGNRCQYTGQLPASALIRNAHGLASGSCSWMNEATAEQASKVALLQGKAQIGPSSERR